MKSANSPDLELLLLSLYEQINDFKKGFGCVNIALEADVSEVVLNGDLVTRCGSATGCWLLKFRSDSISFCEVG